MGMWFKSNEFTKQVSEENKVIDCHVGGQLRDETAACAPGCSSTNASSARDWLAGGASRPAKLHLACQSNPFF